MSDLPSDFDTETEDSIRGPSELAKEISRLKESVIRAAESRDRLPQPLFWSLFSERVKEIRSAKQLKRAIDDVLG